MRRIIPPLFMSTLPDRQRHVSLRIHHAPIACTQSGISQNILGSLALIHAGKNTASPDKRHLLRL